MSCTEVPAQLALQAGTVSYKTAVEHCCPTLPLSTDPTLKTSLLQERRTQLKKKIMLTWWGLLNYTYYLFISRIQIAHLTDVLQGCLNTSAPCLLQCSDSHLLQSKQELNHVVTKPKHCKLKSSKCSYINRSILNIRSQLPEAKWTRILKAFTCLTQLKNHKKKMTKHATYPDSSN